MPATPRTASDTLDPTPSLAARIRLVGSALLAGVAVGGIAVGAGAVVRRTGPIADTVFLLGTVAFGFGLLGWAGSIVAGPGLEAMQAQLGTASGWTEADSRRAMARIGGFGVGVMCAAMVVGTALGYT